MITAIPFAELWWWLPAQTWSLHDSTGSVRCAGGQTVLQPLAQHLTGCHAGVALSHHKVLSFEIPITTCNGHPGPRRSLPNLEELLSSFQEGHWCRGIAQPHHLVKALHAQVGTRCLQEGVILEGAELGRHTVLGGFGDLDEDGVAPRVRVLQCPGTRHGWKY